MSLWRYYPLPPYQEVCDVASISNRCIFAYSRLAVKLSFTPQNNWLNTNLGLGRSVTHTSVKHSAFPNTFVPTLFLLCTSGVMVHIPCRHSTAGTVWTMFFFFFISSAELLRSLRKKRFAQTIMSNTLVSGRRSGCRGNCKRVTSWSGVRVPRYETASCSSCTSVK